MLQRNCRYIFRIPSVYPTAQITEHYPWTLISEGCRHYGVKAKTVALDESRMKAELDAGHPIVINVGPGDFTDTGHFMVITGYDDEGFSINDPNSIEKSGKRWLFKNISSQIRAVWSMYV